MDSTTRRQIARSLRVAANVLEAKIEDYPTEGWGAGPGPHGQWEKARDAWVKKLAKNVKLDQLAKVDSPSLGLDRPDRRLEDAFSHMVKHVFATWVSKAAKGETNKNKYVRVAQAAYDLYLRREVSKVDFQPMAELAHQDAVYKALFDLGEALRDEHPMFKPVPYETELDYVGGDASRYY